MPKFPTMNRTYEFCGAGPIQAAGVPVTFRYRELVQDRNNRVLRENFRDTCGWIIRRVLHHSDTPATLHITVWESLGGVKRLLGRGSPWFNEYHRLISERIREDPTHCP